MNKHVTDARLRFSCEGGDFFVGAPANGKEGASEDVAILVKQESFFARVLSHGNLGLGEAYMDGSFEITHGSLHGFLAILLRNRLDKKLARDFRMGLKVLGIRFVNTARGKWRNVQTHYDIGGDLFELFLDSTMTYSCGYASTKEDDLEQLQANKLGRICQKLMLRPGDRMLDIGCGFGGLLIYAAKNYGVCGRGITNSRDHFASGNAKIQREGLADRISIELSDHRSLNGADRFDRVVSVGMMEHLQRSEYRRYFRNISDSLTPQGVGLVHAVGCNSSKNEHDPFIQKYIFPGSAQPKLSEITSQLERNNLAIIDVENIVRHYHYTAGEWLRRFQLNKARLDPTRYGDVFLRMWEYYLCCCIAAAVASDSAVFQVLFTKDCTAELPLRRV